MYLERLAAVELDELDLGEDVLQVGRRAPRLEREVRRAVAAVLLDDADDLAAVVQRPPQLLDAEGAAEVAVREEEQQVPRLRDALLHPARGQVLRLHVVPDLRAEALQLRVELAALVLPRRLAVRDEEVVPPRRHRQHVELGVDRRSRRRRRRRGGRGGGHLVVGEPGLQVVKVAELLEPESRVPARRGWLRRRRCCAGTRAWLLPPIDCCWHRGGGGGGVYGGGTRATGALRDEVAAELGALPVASRPVGDRERRDRLAAEVLRHSRG
eukprot:SAG11_NODE_3688_length_2256_cov_5.266269_2_plen_269_part_00